MRTRKLESKRIILHPPPINDAELIYKSWTSDCILRVIHCRL